MYVFQKPSFYKNSDYVGNDYVANENNTSHNVSRLERVNENSESESELRKEKLRYEINKIKEESRAMVPSQAQYLHNKAQERIINPLLPPERSYESTYGVPINIPTRGDYSGGYQQLGYLYKDDIDDDTKKIGNNTEPVMLPLYGRPTYNGSNKWMYYISSDKFHSIKMPIENKNKKCDSEYGCDELYADDVVDVPSYNGKFKVNIYEYDKPRYIPYQF